MIETLEGNNKALANLNKPLTLLIDRVIMASYLLSLLSKITSPEPISHFNRVEDIDSNRVNDQLIKKTKPVTLYNNLSTFRNTLKILK